MREETTGVASISDTPSAPATMSVAVTATNDSTTVPRARSVRSQLSSSKLVILDEVSVDITGLNEAETKGRWKHGHNKLEELRSRESSILDGPSQDTGGKPNEPIFIPDLTPRPSNPECSNVGDFFSETVLAREAGPNLGSFVSAGDDTAGPGLTAGCSMQPISDEDINKSKNLESQQLKGRESVHSFATETVESPTYITPSPRKRHNVTFASPIETLVRPDAHAGVATKPERGLQMPVEPFGQWRTWRQEGWGRKDDRIVGGKRFKNSYTSKDDALLPVLVPKTTVSSTDSVCE
ncbi:hypothetical protein F5141DRAFT_1117205 [Pisolithus sp. B1]|nr:hypothetical protein F5141DRAFT_1117205 [Pisolithus sp. B1]